MLVAISVFFIYGLKNPFEQDTTDKMKHDRYNIILLAGDRGADDPLSGALGVKRKALLPINSKPMVSYVLNSLLASERIGDIHIVANDCGDIENAEGLAEFKDRDTIFFKEGKSSPATSIAALLEQGIKYPILVVTADSPLLTPEILDEFLSQAEAKGGDISVGFAREVDLEAKYPAGKRTYLRFKGGGYSGCNLFVLKNEKALVAVKFWQGIEKNRKKAFVIISAFGYWNLILILLRRLDVFGAFERVSKMIRLIVKPIIIGTPEAAIDVDRMEHVAIVEKILDKRAKD